MRYLVGAVLGLSLFAPMAAGRALAAGYTFTPLDVPGAITTEAFGINNSGQIVGDYVPGGHSFLDSAGTFSNIDFPGVVSGTIARGINNDGSIVGNYLTGSGPSSVRHGFLDVGGTFSTLDFPGASETRAAGISGILIVGSYNNTLGRHGFFEAFGAFVPINVPGIDVIETQAFGINDSQQIVGEYVNQFTGLHGFLDIGGTFTTIDFPGAPQTHPFGINDHGDIVGFYVDTTGTHGFLDRGGIFSAIDFPGASRTEAFGINDSGQIVGEYFDSAGDIHGFLATPSSAPVPEPASLLLLASGLAGLVVVGWRRHGT